MYYNKFLEHFLTELEYYNSFFYLYELNIACGVLNENIGCSKLFQLVVLNDFCLPPAKCSVSLIACPLDHS